MLIKQKEIFSNSEGDAYLRRNRKTNASRVFPGKDPIIKALLKILPITNSDNVHSWKLLEIGCSNATRLRWLKKEYSLQCSGLDPSTEAVTEACNCGLDVHQGTADRLPFEKNAFDIVVFGTCLYLCDRDDLFVIAAEADRVLKATGWVLISDFYSPFPRKVEYHHLPGIYSHKMDYSTMFSWHPDYTLMKHNVHKMYESSYTDDVNQWVAISVLRKCPLEILP